MKAIKTLNEMILQYNHLYIELEITDAHMKGDYDMSMAGFEKEDKEIIVNRIIFEDKNKTSKIWNLKRFMSYTETEI